MDKRRGLSLWIQLSLAVIGAAMGAFLVVWYIRRKQTDAQQTSLLSSLPKYIDLKNAVIAPASPSFSASKPANTNEFPLRVSAIPIKFIRHQLGTIRVETKPGTTCRISAVYSTHRKPQSLSSDTIMTDDNGVGEWHWEIGTGGSHVDIEVHVSKNGLQTTTSMHVDIID